MIKGVTREMGVTEILALHSLVSRAGNFVSCSAHWSPEVGRVAPRKPLKSDLLILANSKRRYISLHADGALFLCDLFLDGKLTPRLRMCRLSKSRQLRPLAHTSVALDGDSPTNPMDG